MKPTNRSAPIRRGVVALFAVFALSSCGSKGAVAVTATLQNPSMYVDTASNLAARLNGTFSLYVALGPSASEGTDVSLENFTLIDASTQTPITVLKFMVMPEGPYHVEPGKTFEVTFNINDKGPGQLLTKDEQTALCKPTTTPSVSGSITDDSGSISVNSAKFAIRCP